jgi:toxin ParE1/3/4
VNLLFSEDSFADIGAIGDFIADDDPEQARLFIDRLRQFIDTIADNPRRFRLRSEWGRAVRAANFGNYLIVFEHDDATVHILRIASGRRNMPALISDSE